MNNNKTTSTNARGTPAPTLVPRARGNTDLENQRDWEALRWIARFRFVDVKVLALHLDVSRQQAGARIKRMERVGLVTRSGTPGGTAGWTISVTRRGMRALGLPPRRPARTDLQRDHELALAWLVTRLEHRNATATVKTERECRAAERTTGIRHSADVEEVNDRTTKRWPDLILEHADGRRVVLELERTLKGATRLQRIIDGYRHADWFDEVWLLAADSTVGRTIATALREDALPLPGLARSSSKPAIKLAPWPGLEPDIKRAIEQACAPASEHAGELSR